MSESRIRSIRAKSLTIGFLFTSVSFPHRNDPGGVGTWCMSHNHQPSIQPTPSNESLFPIVEAVVDQCETGA